MTYQLMIIESVKRTLSLEHMVKEARLWRCVNPTYILLEGWNDSLQLWSCTNWFISSCTFFLFSWIIIMLTYSPRQSIQSIQTKLQNYPTFDKYPFFCWHFVLQKIIGTHPNGWYVPRKNFQAIFNLKFHCLRESLLLSRHCAPKKLLLCPLVIDNVLVTRQPILNSSFLTWKTKNQTYQY